MDAIGALERRELFIPLVFACIFFFLFSKKRFTSTFRRGPDEYEMIEAKVFFVFLS